MDKYTIIEKNVVNIVLLIISLLWLLFSLKWAISANDYLLFSRAGCIVVLFAVVVEYRLLPQHQLRIEKGVVYTNGSIKYHEWSNTFKTIQVIAHIAIVFGTIIWGYGDLLMERIFGA